MIYICSYTPRAFQQPRIGKIVQAIKQEKQWILPYSEHEDEIIKKINARNKIDYLIKTRKYLKKTLKKNDLVIGYSHIGGLTSYLSTINTKTKFIYDYPDPWKGWNYYKTSNDNVKWRLGRFLFDKLEKKIYNTASYITTASKSQLNLLQKHGRKDNTCTIYNCPPIKTFNPTNTKKARTDNVIFLGNICEEYGIKTLIKAMQQAPQELLIITRDYQTEFATKILKKIGPNVKLIKSLPYNKVPYYLNTGKIGVIPYENTLYNNVGCPNKLFEYMSCNLVPVVTEMEEFKQQTKNGLKMKFFRFQDANDLARKIEQTLENKEEYKKITAQNLKKIKQEYNWEKQKIKIRKIIEQLTQ